MFIYLLLVAVSSLGGGFLFASSKKKQRLETTKNNLSDYISKLKGEDEYADIMNFVDEDVKEIISDADSCISKSLKYSKMIYYIQEAKVKLSNLKQKVGSIDVNLTNNIHIPEIESMINSIISFDSITKSSFIKDELVVNLMNQMKSTLNEFSSYNTITIYNIDVVEDFLSRLTYLTQEYANKLNSYRDVYAEFLSNPKAARSIRLSNLNKSVNDLNVRLTQKGLNKVNIQPELMNYLDNLYELELHVSYDDALKEQINLWNSL
jgi:hypothetical protein